MKARHFDPAILAALIATAIAIVFQESVIGHMSISGIVPDLMLLLVVDWGIIRGVEEGMLWGFIGGIFLDLYSGLPFGTSSLAFVVIVGLFSLAQTSLLRPGIIIPVSVAVAATILYYSIAIFLSASITQQVPGAQLLLRSVIGVAVYNAILNPFIFSACRAVDRRLHPIARTTW